MTEDTQIKVKEALIQIFDELSEVRKVEVLEFALFMRTRDSQKMLDLSPEIGELIAHLQPDSQQHPLQGSVLHYDEPFEPVALQDWETLQ